MLYHHEDQNNFAYSPRVKPFIQPVVIDTLSVDMEIDTGCSVTLLPKRLWLELGSPDLSSSTLRLRTYTGGKLNILGEFVSPVTINGETKSMLVTVVDGDGPALLGRNWLLQTRLNWQSMYRMGDPEDSVPAAISDRLRPYRDVFTGELGLIKTNPIHLDLKADAVPKFHRPRPVPFSLHDRVKMELNRLEKTGVLKKVQHSEWAAPIVVVDKPDGGTRICGDYKVTINANMRVDQYPLPRPDDIFASLQGGVYFSKLDLSQAYFQLALDEDSQKLVTINTIQGLYQYTRLPFGVASAPAKFQQVMDNLLSDLPGVRVYLDDILVFGSSLEEMWKNVCAALHRLQSSNVRLQLSKCQFAVTKLPFLGHVIGKDGLATDPEKIKAIQQARRPTSVSELRSFLGLATYYGKFVPALSAVTYPLNQLLKKEKAWSWRKEEEVAWCKLKNLLSSTTTLCHFSPDLPLHLACDASSYGIAAVLSHQFPDGSERPLAYASRSLTSAEKNYSQLDKEALSIIFGVKRFHNFIYGRKFLLQTDHKPLLAILQAALYIPGISHGYPLILSLSLSREIYPVYPKYILIIASKGYTF